ncbi:hypothetical protein ACFQZE_06730 [Paenibacillus sp. GCM10027627]|uniref:hypothetical protein n=1 Tax=unclassified Paenibacillus TaxID=185978 RepID=UPI0036407D9A
MSDYHERVDKMKEKLYMKVFSFMADNRINCTETIHQCDWVIENAPEFIEELLNVIKPNLPLIEYED